MTEPVIQPDETVRIEKGDTRAGEPWPEREPWTADKLMRLVGMGIAWVVIVGVAVIVVMLVVAAVILVAGWAFDG